MHKATDSPRRSLPGDREMVVMMAMVMALNALAIDSMLPALPAIGEALGVAVANDRQYVISIYLLGIGFGSLIYGPLSDRFGRKGVLVPALFAYLALSIGCGLATSFEMLLALRFVHGLVSAALGVIVVAVIRDLFVGDAMAKRLSLIFLVFMIVPIIAPTLGAGVAALAGWRAIFVVLAVMSVAMLLWLRRLPETLDAADVRPLDLKTMAAGWATVTRHRRAAGYMIASGTMQGALYGYLNSSEQIIGEVFDARSLFPLIFACVAIGIAIANFSNAAIVERFGARRVSQSAVFAFMATSILQIVAALSGAETLGMFTALMMVNVGLIGFIGSNFGSIAMEDFGHMAGVASSYQSFAKTLLAAVVGAAIGQQYDGTTLPLAYAFLMCAIVGLALVLWAERGRLFTRPGTAPKSPF
ncbi:multidrug effflux MFS transporter [Sphingopyxis alaskensis]|jgi:MFS transporter, DHA1 family, multidrug resistance protein|uniref:Bcr/CflA family efflux transporter n=1 Tax=Sphingopyxis alaskensis (strain DSM 13593 / LMG 18877 / RB2256) TaxID=317655 RepID=Q1GQH8_SPHAL|nr:multidrug effflux MFS transporter [Sphingopyxis alaskensis]ABF54094.1 Drug resistance transporter Bcr/CflA subfamily [Sphingopyxis alaskensis RB2256]MCM3418830.1 multidrug effflux MFS transporter [Sphingopyxis alaskensis]